jgi:phage-related protein
MSVNLTEKVMYQVSKRSDYKYKETRFGDGYTQIVIDGLNFDREQWNVQFVPLNNIQASNLEVKLSNSVNGTSNYLRWKGPGEINYKLYIAKEISKNPIAPDKWSVSCRLQREYALN